MKIFETDQEVFDAVWAHMKKQNAFSSYNVEGCIKCMYLHPENGNMCAIGGILPPEIDKTKLRTGKNRVSSSSINTILCGDLDEFEFATKEAAKVKETFEHISRIMLSNLQEAHDTSAEFCDKQGIIIAMEKFKEQMVKIAKKFNLQFPEN